MRRVYIAVSLDGYIAGPDNDLEWLEHVPNPSGSDFGFADHMASIDAVVMGRGTFEAISHIRPWPYDKPVVVASSTLAEMPAELGNSVRLMTGTPEEVVQQCADLGYLDLYIDGGRLVTSFLRSDLIDEMVLSRIPVILGGGILLFGPLPAPTWWEHVETTAFDGGLVQSVYRPAPTRTRVSDSTGPRLGDVGG
ncbi:MAG: dihydrofolate reductase [Acidimicrobiales bacterium]|nr:dihydrofolate reductase [Acidimicrobiales bacterium]